MTPTSVPGARLVLFRAVLITATLAIVELGSLMAIRVLNTRLDQKIRRVSDILTEQSALIRVMLDETTPQLHELHPRLGWRYAPNYDQGQHRLNAAALRSAREYAERAPDNVLRVAAFGDSFVYGSEVDNADAWPALIERDPTIEVLNYGVPGYGTDQALLRYRLEGARYAPRVVLLGFPETDLPRVVNVYRRYYNNAEVPLFKPRFDLDDTGHLVLRETPVPGRDGYRRLLEHPEAVLAYGAHDQWFEPSVYRNPLHDWSAFVRLASAAWFRVRLRTDPDRVLNDGVFNRASKAYAIQMALFQAFVDEVRARGALPLIVVIPDRHVLGDIAGGRTRMDQPVLDDLQAHGLPFVDLAEAFAEAGLGSDFMKWIATSGHYNADGAQVVAAWLAPRLRQRASEAR